MPRINRDALKHDGRDRFYQLYLPKSYDSSEAFSLVMYLHGGGGSMNGAFNNKLDGYAEKYHFILVVPAGTGPGAKRFLGWRSGKIWQSDGSFQELTKYATQNNIDDVGYLSTVLDDVATKLNINPNKVFVTGISNGGAMSYRLACEMPEKITAIAAVASAGYDLKCTPKKPVPVMHIHGKSDPSTLFYGGRGKNPFGFPYGKLSEFSNPSAKTMIEKWQVINQCSNSSKQIYQKGQAQCLESDACKKLVVFCFDESMGHTWPSGEQYFSPRRIGQVTYDISFDQIWGFFAKQ